MAVCVWSVGAKYHMFMFDENTIFTGSYLVLFNVTFEIHMAAH